MPVSGIIANEAHVMETADGGDVEAATKQLELALLIDGALRMAKAD